MKTILYIEDEPDYIEIAKDYLQAYNYEIIPASDGEEGLKKALELKPDLILLDIFLPKIRGFELCERLKQNAATKDIPILVISASGVEYLEQQCKNVGASDCIRKPYKAEELIFKTRLLLKDV